MNVYKRSISIIFNEENSTYILALSNDRDGTYHSVELKSLEDVFQEISKITNKKITFHRK